MLGEVTVERRQGHMQQLQQKQQQKQQQKLQ